MRRDAAATCTQSDGCPQIVGLLYFDGLAMSSTHFVEEPALGAASTWTEYLTILPSFSSTASAAAAAVEVGWASAPGRVRGVVQTTDGDRSVDTCVNSLG